MLKDYHHVSRPPRSLKYGGVYWATENMIRRFTVETKHTQSKNLPPIELFKRIGGENDDEHERILIPRGCCPVPAKTDYRSHGIKTEYTSNVVPRDQDQIKFLHECKYLLSQKRSFVAEAPTGFGKTIMGVDLISFVGTTTLIVIHKEDIENQWRKALKEQLGLEDHEIGIIKGDKIQVKGKKVVIGYIQSLHKEHRYPDYVYDYFGFILVDEVHKIGAEKFSQMAWLFSALLWLGLSATPYRKDGNDIIFHAHIGEVEVRVKRMNLIPKIITARTNFRIPCHTRRNPKTGEQEWAQVNHSGGKGGAVVKAMATDTDRNDIIGEFCKSAYDKTRYVVIFADTKAHLEELENVLVLWGIRRSDIGYYVGGMSEEAREKAKTRRICLATYQMTESATDNPIWDTAVLATPRADVVQIVGRILRIHPTKCSLHNPQEGKNIPVVLDLVDHDSKVYLGYFKSRMRWYDKIKAKVV